MNKRHSNNPEAAEKAAADFRATTEVKTVSIESTGIKGMPDQQSEPAQTTTYAPKIFDLTKAFGVCKKPEQKALKKGSLYFSCLLEQDGKFIALPAKGMVGKVLCNLFFKEIGDHAKGTKFQVKLFFDYKLSYYSKENTTTKTLGIKEIKGMNLDGENAIHNTIKEIEEFQKSKKTQK